MTQKFIRGFTGKWRFLSNFYVAHIEYKSLKFRTSEHAYQWEKCVDDKSRRHIIAALTPGEAKRRGAHVTCRRDWDRRKVQMMRQVVAAKFAPGSELAQELIDTGDAILIEENNWGDKFWGTVDGEGENWLGRVLMDHRDKLLTLAKSENCKD